MGVRCSHFLGIMPGAFAESTHTNERTNSRLVTL